MKVDTHIHSIYSDGLSTIEEIAREARAKGLDAVFITDHDKLYSGPKELFGVKLLRGEEVSSKSGHILALFIEERIPPGLSAEETVERIHEAGGIAIAAHPFDRLRKGIGKKLFELDVDAIEINGYVLRPTANDLAIKAAQKLNKPLTAGTDAHYAKHVGYCYMLVEELSPEGILRGEPRCKIVPLRKRLSVYLRRKIR